jgi:hypothetical protein
MKYCTITFLTILLYACENDKKFTNEKLLLPNSQNELKQILTQNLRETTKINKVLRLYDQKKITQEYAIDSISSLYNTLKQRTSSHFIDEESNSEFDFFLSSLVKQKSNFAISLLEKTLRISKSNSLEEVLNNLEGFNTIHFLDLRLINGLLQKSDFKISVKNFSKFLALLAFKSSPLTNDILLILLSKLKKLPNVKELSLDSIFLQKILNILERKLKTNHLDNDLLEKISNVYDLCDYFFNLNVKEFDGSSRGLFEQWQAKVDYLLERKISEGQFSNGQLNTLDLNPQIFFLLNGAAFSSLYETSRSNLRLSSFMKKYYAFKYLRQRPGLSLSKNEYDEMNKIHRDILSHYLGEELLAKDLNIEINSQGNNLQLFLPAGIYHASNGEEIFQSTIIFSPMALLLAPNSSLTFYSEILIRPWIDVSGNDANNIEYEKSIDNGEVPIKNYVHIPDPAHGNPIATVRGLREHNTAPRSFDPCTYDGKNPSWVCIVKMSFEYSDGRTPSKQDKGADGGDGGKVVLKKLKKVIGKGYIFSNGGKGARGHKGTNSPLCETKGGVTKYTPLENTFSEHFFTCTSSRGCEDKDLVKGIDPIVSSYFPYSENTPLAIRTDKPLIHLSRGESGDGGNGGDGGSVIFETQFNLSNLTAFVFPGAGGKPGEISDCGPEQDLMKERKKEMTGLVGNPGIKGKISY